MTAQILQFPNKEVAYKANDLLHEAMRLYECQVYLVIAYAEMQLAMIKATLKLFTNNDR